MATGSWGPAIDEVEPVKEYINLGGRFFHRNVSAEVLNLLSRDALSYWTRMRVAA